MQREIERKFLVNDKVKPVLANCLEKLHISQGYLSKDPERIVRIRHYVKSFSGVLNDQSCGLITIKTKSQNDTAAGVNEFEYEIPFNDAIMLLKNCHKPILNKTRHIHNENGHKWEIDVFFGNKQGLILAEVELSYPDEHVDLPAWIETEVTGQPEYSNANM